VHPAEKVGNGVPLKGAVFQQDPAKTLTGLFMDLLGFVKLICGNVPRLLQDFADFEFTCTGLIFYRPFYGTSGAGVPFGCRFFYHGACGSFPGLWR